ncbi:unnamed protein product [Gulo gulo]|uniref:Uncharacterized protein n=1 Tax=Gulo gulo TaxID=48420 RepID=A0A9X9LP35_GULGU|nr:unnamed protein product [Gulo gulo]
MGLSDPGGPADAPLHRPRSSLKLLDCELLTFSHTCGRGIFSLRSPHATERVASAVGKPRNHDNSQPPANPRLSSRFFKGKCL